MIIKQMMGFGLMVTTALLVGCQSKPASTDAAQSTLGAADSSLSASGSAVTGAYGVNRSVASVQPQTDAQGFIINNRRAPSSQTYYFAFDRSELRNLDLKALQVQANYLATHTGAAVRLEGNTDNRGSREYNIALGWRRDQTVARILEQQGVRPSQIQMISYGKERPVIVGQGDNAWALNRRVNLVYKVTG